MPTTRTVAALASLVVLLAPIAGAQTVRLSYDASVHAGPITGRAYVFISRTDRTEPRRQSGAQRTSEPFFGVDVEALKPGHAIIFDKSVLGFPLASLDQLPAGEYFVQGLILPYTQFKRSDGHTIWAHMDAGEGQRWNSAPGSLVSEVIKVRIDPARRATITLSLTKVLPPIAPTADTEWVKRFRITSRLASTFWGQDMPLGAVVLLPKGYEQNSAKRYPVVYTIGHYSDRAPFGFTFEGCESAESAEARATRLARSMREPGCEFQQAWTSGQVPEFIAARRS